MNIVRHTKHKYARIYYLHGIAVSCTLHSTPSDITLVQCTRVLSFNLIDFAQHKRRELAAQTPEHTLICLGNLSLESDKSETSVLEIRHVLQAMILFRAPMAWPGWRKVENTKMMVMLQCVGDEPKCRNVLIINKCQYLRCIRCICVHQ